MRLLTLGPLFLASAFILSACEKPTGAAADKAIADVNVIDAVNLNDIMLTVADPNEAVTYFQRASAQQPDRLDFRRGLAKSLIRAGRAAEAVVVFAKITTADQATNKDRVGYADALIRTNQWSKAEAQLKKVPPTYETYRRYRLAAMIADSNRDWKKADSFYETAAGLTTKPAGVLNNWGFSKLTRGDFAQSEKLFLEAITYDPTMFTAKNNLALARAAQKKYTLPIIRMTQAEKAKLLYTMALSAIKQGDLDIARGLLRDAIDTDPQYFDAAERTLQALQTGAKG